MTWRPADRDDRRVAALWATCAGLTLLLRPLWIAATEFLPPCPWHELTGWPCPGCGTTRAIVRLLHADPFGALAANPLAATAAAAFVAGGLAAPVWIACGGQRPSIPARQRPAWMAASAAAFLANWSWLAVSGV
jgi:hypothetical protein